MLDVKFVLNDTPILFESEIPRVLWGSVSEQDHAENAKLQLLSGFTQKDVNSSINEQDLGIDFLMSTGGLIWKCDFMPRTGTFHSVPDSAYDEVIAVAVHPNGVRRNKAGQTVHGLGAVQLWTLPSASNDGMACGAKPFLSLCLAHKGLVTWDVKWCPNPELVHVQPQRLRHDAVAKQDAPGSATMLHSEDRISHPNCSLTAVSLLAFVSGDGCVHIVSVPKVSEVHRLSAGPAVQGSRGVHPLMLEVPPQYLITRDMLRGSVPCSLEWQQTSSASNPGCSAKTIQIVEETNQSASKRSLKLLIGSYDGMVSGWKLPCSSIHMLHNLFIVRADTLPIWVVQWCPACAAHDSLDSLQAHNFMTMSHSGTLKIWDDRDLTLPLHKQLISRNPIRSGAWGMNPHSCLSVHEDGCLRQLLLDPIVHNSTREVQLMSLYSVPNQGCLWAVSACHSLGFVLYCGANGVAVIMKMEVKADSRRRLPHAAIGGLSMKEGIMHVLTPAEASGLQTVFAGSSGGQQVKSSRGRGKAPSSSSAASTDIMDEAQALYACAVSPNIEQGRVWIAYGGYAGLLRCQRISLAL
ncbi:hypothetical protein CEUSTIGMA_g6301.t1 [Chlamydomonas eustigma]|uniref:Transcription factor IIIC 90kDa subunit N-terminal domain-containing protein n=1 Tax=Chlamydomonas eustigma TaxID=1157962 RepID=A0A250X6Z8_9CHLO|nr:hypothetical protein CEUSTIGMA_g6301.t1 [Chlamydomonas eustigma]|eukprot:GAX78863.1 hypothetical protein CEUSTIGMA_g6301.t1 [Chlamydomonas eustigma]